MKEQYKKKRYVIGKGVSVSHTWGNTAGESTLSFSHYTKSCMFYYFIKGTGSIKIEGKNYDISEGDIVMINPSELYMCEVYDCKFHERLVLRADYDILGNFSENALSIIKPFYEREKGKGNLITSENVKKSGVKKLLDNIFEHSKKEEPAENILAVCKTIEFLFAVRNLFSLEEGKENKSKEHPLVNEVLTYLNNHFKEQISLPLIAYEFNIDKSYLSHLFKEYVGLSLWNYVINKRINFFNELVLKGYSTKEAYFAAGFENYSNFFRLYKKYMNMTPTEFKRKNNHYKNIL